ncbi:5-formyltetrahydrofolate cyclo-ligase [Paractinoplanes ferrugineus]|uniref:5-formyltetrahydrofolate cyclo-ligase n=1 Tax=Paractinoplanes ferrugineus TaxID=113564 RepID=UPI0023B31D3B
MPDLTGDGNGSPPAKVALRSQLITARRTMSPETRLAANRQLQRQILACVRRAHPPVIAAYVPIGTEPGGPDLPEVLAAHAPVLLPVLLPDGDLDWTRYTGPSSLAPAPRGLREPTGPRLGVAAIATAALILVPALAVDHRGHRLGKGGGSYDRALTRLPARVAAHPSPPVSSPPTSAPPPSRPPASVPPAAAPPASRPPASVPPAAAPPAAWPSPGAPPASAAAGFARSDISDLSVGWPARQLVVALLYDGELLDEVPGEPHDQPVDAVITPRGGFTLSRAVEWTK